MTLSCGILQETRICGPNQCVPPINGHLKTCSSLRDSSGFPTFGMWKTSVSSMAASKYAVILRDSSRNQILWSEPMQTLNLHPPQSVQIPAVSSTNPDFRSVGKCFLLILKSFTLKATSKHIAFLRYLARIPDRWSEPMIPRAFWVSEQHSHTQGDLDKMQFPCGILHEFSLLMWELVTGNIFYAWSH